MKRIKIILTISKNQKAMKKMLLTIVVVLFGMALNAQVSVWDGTAEPWTHGSGTPEDPYLIESAQNMAYIAQIVNEPTSYGAFDVFVDTYFKLTTDLDLGGDKGLLWEPIGKYTVFGPPTTLFAGHFNGGGHTIYNMRIEVPEEDSKSSNKKLSFGLFGMARYGSIKNITLASDCNVDINNYTLYGDTNYACVGGILGYGDKVSLEDCENRASIRFDGSAFHRIACGGLFGSVSGSVINNCHNMGNVYSREADNYGGHTPAGIVAHASDCTIFGCTNSGNITCVKYDYGIHTRGVASGGIVGKAEMTCTVEQCCNTGTLLTNEVDATTIFISSGGIVGCSYTGAQTLNLLIKNCYSISDISAITAMPEYKGNFAGGILGGTYGYQAHEGYDTNVTIENCYVVGTITADTIGGIVAKYGIMGCPKMSRQLTVSNSYYINTVESMNEYGMAVSDDYMKSEEFVAALNAAGAVFKMDEDNVNNGYPVFINRIPQAVDENIADRVISVYPNPASGIISVGLDDNADCHSVEIFSLDGRLVKSQNANFNAIDISSLASGLYIIKVRTEDGREYNERIVKE